MTRWRQRNIPKTHWLAAVCVGQSTPDELKLDSVQPLLIKAMGRGQRQVCDNDKFGFRRKKNNGEFNAPRLTKRVHSFQTGDVVKVAVPRGKYRGPSIGRLASVRASSSVLRPKLKWQEATINATK